MPQRLINWTNAKFFLPAGLVAAYWLFASAFAFLFGRSHGFDALLPTTPETVERLLAGSLVAAALTIAVYVVQRAHKRSDSELRACNQQYSSVLASTFDSVFFLNRDSEVVDANASAATAFGADSETLKGRCIDTFIHRCMETLPNGTDTVRDLVASRPECEVGPVQVIATGLDGRRFPAEFNLVPADECGSRYALLLRELSGEVNARMALRETENRYRLLVDQVPVGIFRSLPNGKILDANQALLDILGVDSPEDLTDNYTTADFYVDIDDREDRLARIHADGAIHNHRADIRAVDGSIRHTITSAVLIDNDPEHGQILQGSTLDISDLERAREALHDTDVTLRTLTENSLDMVIVINDRGQIEYCSTAAREFIGEEPSAQIGKHLSDLVHSDDVAAVRRVLRIGRRKSSDVHALTCRVKRVDGGHVLSEAVSRSFRDSNGRLRSVINVRDISERERTAAQLQQAQKMQAVGQLTGGIAHDFNNLLTVIVGNLQLVQEQLLDRSTRENIDAALAACVRGGDLTRRLLALARRQPLEPRIVSANKLIDSIDPLLKRSLGKSVRIDVDCEADIWSTKVDPSLLESSILNLAINSRDALEGGGSITLRTANRTLSDCSWADLPADAHGDYVCVEVEDTGGGMDAETLRRAVDPFFTTKADSGGSGLGLSMVYGFVQQSGGQMHIESQPGVGTRVEIYLPRTDEVEEQASLSDLRCDLPFGGESVLVVDDNDEVRNSAAALIKRLGYKVRTANCGRAALDMLHEESADLVFSDIMMPEMSGFALAERVTAERPEISVLLTTGYADDSILDTIDGQSRFDILYKPYNQIELAKRIRNALDH